MDWMHYQKYSEKKCWEAKVNLIQTAMAKVHLPKDGQVLEIGFGSGNVTRNALLPALPEHSTVIAIENDARCVQNANEKYSDKRIKFLHLDALDLHQLDTKFDLIVSLFFLQLIRNQRLLWKRLDSKLKDGGSIVMLTLGGGYSFVESIFKLSKLEKYKRYMQDVDTLFAEYLYVHDQEKARRVYEDFLRSVLPDSKVTVTNSSKTLTFESREAMYHHYKGVNYFNHRMGEETTDCYLNDLIESIQQLEGFSCQDYCANIKMMIVEVKK